MGRATYKQGVGGGIYGVGGCPRGCTRRVPKEKKEGEWPILASQRGVTGYTSQVCNGVYLSGVSLLGIPQGVSLLGIPQGRERQWCAEWSLSSQVIPVSLLGYSRHPCTTGLSVPGFLAFLHCFSFHCWLLVPASSPVSLLVDHHHPFHCWPYS